MINKIGKDIQPEYHQILKSLHFKPSHIHTDSILYQEKKKDPVSLNEGNSGMYQLYHANQKAHITPTNTTLSIGNSEVVFKVAKSLLLGDPTRLQTSVSMNSFLT